MGSNGVTYLPQTSSVPPTKGKLLGFQDVPSKFRLLQKYQKGILPTSLWDVVPWRSVVVKDGQSSRRKRRYPGRFLLSRKIIMHSNTMIITILLLRFSWLV